MRWLGLTDEEWDKEIEILRDMTVHEFLDFIKADFTRVNMIRLALHHPKGGGASIVQHDSEELI